jgi:hypothetical protein
MSEGDIDAMIERVAREEQEELDRSHGQHILDATAARSQHADPLTDALRRAYQAKAEENHNE